MNIEELYRVSVQFNLFDDDDELLQEVFWSGITKATDLCNAESVEKCVLESTVTATFINRSDAERFSEFIATYVRIYNINAEY